MKKAVTIQPQLPHLPYLGPEDSSYPKPADIMVTPRILHAILMYRFKSKIYLNLIPTFTMRLVEKFLVKQLVLLPSKDVPRNSQRGVALWGSKFFEDQSGGERLALGKRRVITSYKPHFKHCTAFF